MSELGPRVLSRPLGMTNHSSLSGLRGFPGHWTFGLTTGNVLANQDALVTLESKKDSFSGRGNIALLSSRQDGGGDVHSQLLGLQRQEAVRGEGCSASPLFSHLALLLDEKSTKLHLPGCNTTFPPEYSATCTPKRSTD